MTLASESALYTGLGTSRWIELTSQRRIQVVGLTIRNWDVLAPTTEPAEANE
jgi:hypothetical protein